MPLEIRELIITATVSNEVKETAPQHKTSSTKSEKSPQEIINICVEQVLEILREKEER